MKPLYLEFKGLNSFSENTRIDFTPLLKGGIFGIFGETGSGKSTILDAINFALFGDIGRSAVKTDKINDKCDSLEVKFTFDIFSDGKRRKYYVERSIKRKSGTHKAMLYELEEDDDKGGQCLADNVKSVDAKIVEIIGINEEDFKKCIALPQGEFSKFVKSAPSERTELIERLFSLQKYGENLKFKLSRYKAQKEGEFNTLTGRLYSFDGVSKEKLKELKEEAASLLQAETLLKKQADEALAAHNLQKKLFEDKSAYELAKNKLEALRAEKPYYDTLGKQLAVLPYCVTAADRDGEVKNLSRQIENHLNERQNLKNASAACESKRASLAEKIKGGDYDGEYAKLSELYGKMSGLKPEADRLKKMSEDLAACRKKYQQRQSELNQINKKVSDLHEKLNLLQAKLENTPEPDLNKYFSSQLKGGILKEEYAKNLCYIKDLQDGVNFFADGSALYDYITKELNAKADEYKQLILSVKDVKTDISGQLQTLSDMLKKRREAENEVKNCVSSLEIEKQKKENAKGLLAEALAEGERLKREFDSLKEKLSSVFGEQADYYSAAETVRKQAEEVKARQRADEENLKKYEKELSEYAVKIAAKEQALKSAEERKAAAAKELEDCLKKAGASDAADCLERIKKYGVYEQAIEKYNRYNAEYSAVESQVAVLEKKCGGIEISAETLKFAEEGKIKAESDYSSAVQLRAVKESEIKSFEKRLEQKKQLDKELEKLNAERGVIAQLDKLIKDNKFMKYIANEHL
ncbi:MAG: SMC family ATPase, partial [Clostridia bacterium]|nr:SMC family ATPase [Clostridia bacterium]